MTKKIYGALLSLMVLTGCVMTEKGTPSDAGAIKVSKKGDAVWFTGSVEQALAAAQKADKPILLYWGAVWCPPCAEIKSQVFSHPEFPTLIEDLIAVYIDGDSEGAQVYSDRFDAQGYPTLLVLGPDGKELMRIDHGVSFSEFASALRAAVASSEPVQALVSRAREGKATQMEWTRIAFQYGEELTQSSESKDLLVTRRDLFQQCPANLVTAKARLAGFFLADAAGWNEEQRQKEKDIWHSIASAFEPAANDMLASVASTEAARGTIIYNAGSIIKLLAPDAASGKHQLWKDKWLKAAAHLQGASHLSIDTRLWSVYPELAIHRAMLGKEAVVPAALRGRIIAAAAQADREAVTETDRKAVVSGAAYLLQLVQEYDKARTMLRKELAITKTPWYYQSSLSSLEQAAGDMEQALVWSEKARKSAEGRATKIQWIVEDLRLTAKNAAVPQYDRLSALIAEYYETAFALSDGFSGRNARRAQLVADALKPWANDQRISSVWQPYREKCSRLKPEQAQTCQGHFDTLAKN